MKFRPIAEYIDQARIPEIVFKKHPFLNLGSRRYDGSFRDQDNSIANEVVVAIHILRFPGRGDNHVITNASIFVDDRSLDGTARTDSEWWTSRQRLGIFVLVKIRAHQDAITDRSPVFNDAANPDHRPVDIRMGDDATFGDNRLVNLGTVNFAGGKKTGVRVDRVEGIKKIIGRHGIREGQVCFEKSSDGSDILPVPLKNIGEDFVFVERGWNDVFAEIVETVVQRIDQDLAIEHIDTHRSLVEFCFGWSAQIG